MKAAVFHGPKDMCVEEIADPVCGDTEVKLKVLACAICGTDIRIYHHGHKLITPPHVTGHEIAGEVVEVGGAVRGVAVGERCTVVTPVGCGRCRYCLAGKQNVCVDFRAIGYNFPGGFAQYVIVPEEAVRQGSILAIPRDIDPCVATLVEPLSCVLNGQEFLHIGVGDVVVVVGAGPIGCMHAKLAKACGAGKVVIAEVSRERLELARRFECDLYVNPAEEDLAERVMTLTGGVGADVVIVACSSATAQEQALAYVARQGRISFFGGLPKDAPIINFDSNLLHYREVSVFGAFASHATQYKKCISMVANKAFHAQDLITGRFPLGRIVHAMEEAQSARGLKVVVTPG